MPPQPSISSSGCAATILSPPAQTTQVIVDPYPYIDPFTTPTPVICEGDNASISMVLLLGEAPIIVDYSYNGNNYTYNLGSVGQITPISATIPIDLSGLQIGSNQITINNLTAEEAWRQSDKVEAILEKRIDFDTELSIIGVRTNSGDSFFYPLVENFHKNGILDVSIAPYSNHVLQKKAESYHKKIGNELEYVGILVIEFFLDKNGELIANEMAPRVHNSGHWTNEGASISQFEAHIMAISKIKIENIITEGNSGMINILSKMPRMNNLNDNDSYSFYDYGKSERLNRKLGHITLIDPNRDILISKLSRLKEKIF